MAVCGQAKPVRNTHQSPVPGSPSPQLPVAGNMRVKGATPPCGVWGRAPKKFRSLYPTPLPLLFPLRLHTQNHFFHLLHQFGRADTDEGLACVHVLVMGEVQGIDNAFGPVVAQ